MKVDVVGQQMEIGNALKEHVTENVISNVSKYFAMATDAHVHFIKRHHTFYADIVVRMGTGRLNVVKSSANSDDVYHAFDLAIGKVVKQCRKYKSKLNDYSKTVKISEVPNSINYIISPNKSEENESEVMEDNPVIIAESPMPIQTLSVSQAVMRMDLEELPALMFKNSRNNKVNVVYYRSDGNISWVDYTE